MEHLVEIVVALITVVIGPLAVAWTSRKWNEEDRELADEAVAQLKAELSLGSVERRQLREQLASLQAGDSPSPMTAGELGEPSDEPSSS